MKKNKEAQHKPETIQIKIGDKVIVKQEKRNKATSKYDPKPYN